MKRKKNPYTIVIFWVISLIWMELVFHWISFGTPDIGALWPVLLVLPVSGFFAVISGLTKSEKWNFRITAVLLCLCTAVFCANLVYYGVFRTYLAVFSTIAQGNAARALGFGPFFRLGLKTVAKNWAGIVLLFMPFLTLLLLGKKMISFRRRRLAEVSWIAGGMLAMYMVSIALINTGSKDPYSVYDLYYHNSSLSAEIEKLGVTTSMRLDLRSVLFGSQSAGLHDVAIQTTENWQEDTGAVLAAGDAGGDAAGNAGGVDGDTAVNAGGNASGDPDGDPAGSAASPEGGQDGTETGDGTAETDLHDLYQFQEIDFDALTEGCEDENLRTMHEYFAAQTPVKKNDYTGLYEGYNLIFITAEGFSPYAVDEELTPTLYRLVNSGYVFTNFYTPLWYGSTCGGEYVNLTSQYPKDGGYLSLQESGARGTDMYHSLGRYMERAGYQLWGFHNNSCTYYGRNLSMPNMGYENWIATKSGYDPEINQYGNEVWPQSDLRLIEQSFDMYADQEPFHVYYMTVSGHVEYSFSGNAMSQKNRDAVADLPLSDTARAYLACQIELDRALEELIALLEEKGIADHTLLVMSADHIPYNNEEMCDELAAWQLEKAGVSVPAGYRLEANFERYRNNLILWTGSMEEGEKVVVDKPCYSLDILPTVLNLLGIDYESRVLMGRDIFSDTEGLVVFPNRSWITETARYNAVTGEATAMSDEPIPEGYIAEMNRIVRDKLLISRQIVEMDYYSYLHD